MVCPLPLKAFCLSLSFPGFCRENAELPALSQALRILMLDIPSPANVGDSIELTCSYELEGDRLYSVKWYAVP